MEGIAASFDEYFRVRYADARTLAEAAYRIRYQVYVEEMGWEPPNKFGLETDEYDDHSHICLLEHRRTRTFAGCVRLVKPDNDWNRQASLPFQHHDITCIRSGTINPRLLTQGTFGEISRLAVPNTFRRRKHEWQRPFILDERCTVSVFSEEEKRGFPNIAIGLYLASIAMVDICGHEGVFVVMEPKLQRHLQRFGLPFTQISEKFYFRGTRALFGLLRQDLSRHMPPNIQQLYKLIKVQLAQQMCTSLISQ